MIIAIVCEKMKWTYQQYLDQPVPFIKMLLLKFNIEAEEQNREAKRTSMKAK